MVITRNYAAKNNIELYEGLSSKKKRNNYTNEETHYVFRFLIFIWIFTLTFIAAAVVYNHLHQNHDKSLYNFIITDLPEKTILQLYNSIPARPYNKIPSITYNYILDMFQEYNIDYF